MTLSLKVISLSVVFAILGTADTNAQVRLGPEAAEKLVLEKPEAAYPAIAKQVRADGLVRVEITVSDQGVVTAAKAISGHPLLQAAAVSAVKKRKYRSHHMEGKPVAFITDVYIRFPPGAVSPEQEEAHDLQAKLADQYFEKERVCRSLVKEQKWKEAQGPCLETVQVGDQLGDNRTLEKMGAYELWGYVLRGQKRYDEALKSFTRALEIVGPTLDDTSAELGGLYGNLAISHHLMRDLPKARAWYKRAEQIFRQAHATFGNNDPDEWVVKTRKQYLKSLKDLLQYHLLAAEDDGATTEVEEIKEALKTLP